MAQPQKEPPADRQLRERSLLYIFIAFVLGFALPICSCLGLGIATTTALGRMASRGAATLPRATGPAVVVIPLEGLIATQTEAYAETITPEQVSELLERAEADSLIQAIVLRIESPGGGVVASNEIYHMIRETEKPVVVSMGSVAASGGYYIACAADHIVANPDTLTGSIGVISQFPNAEELMEKIGVEVVVIASGSAKDIGSPFRDMTEEERAIWERIISETYEAFVAVVAERRDLSPERVRELADGRVYTGRQALETGLVDQLGTLEDAVAKAAELGDIEGKPEVLELEPPPSLYELLTDFQAHSSLPSLEELLDWAAAPSLEYRYVEP
ncbi:MAG: signal peptide peptidase SppA [Anaerolineae bacterium]